MKNGATKTKTTHTQKTPTKKPYIYIFYKLYPKKSLLKQKSMFHRFHWPCVLYFYASVLGSHKYHIG